MTDFDRRDIQYTQNLMFDLGEHGLAVGKELTENGITEKLILYIVDRYGKNRAMEILKENKLAFRSLELTESVNRIWATKINKK